MLVTLGMTFQIEEQDFREMLMERMNQFDMAKFENEVQASVKRSARTPRPVFSDSRRCIESKSWLIDPTVELDRDIVDMSGNVLVKKGARYNSLKYRKLSSHLLFIEGKDNDQVQYALSFSRKRESMDPILQGDDCNLPAKIILVNGSPVALEEEKGVPIFFDQGGHLCRKLSISAFPARVFQEGDKLRCEEVVI